jgi:ATP-dependent DNA ligase
MQNIDFEKKELSCKHGDYCVGKATALTDQGFHARAVEFRRRLSGAMRAISAPDIYKIRKGKGYVVSKKYDGEFALVGWDGKKIVSVNPGGTVRIGLPCYDEAEKLLKKAKVKSCILGAELYVIGQAKGNRVQQVVGMLRNPSSKAQLEKIGMAVFDVIEFDDKEVGATADVYKLLDKWFKGGKLAHGVEHKPADGPDKISELFTEWVIGEELEGIVVRHDQVGWYKIKVRHNLDAAIIGYSEGTENRKGMLHDLLVAVMRNDGTFHELARVGGGFTDEDRRSLVEELRRRIVPSDYVAVNNDYVAYEMTEPGPVIEISCLDLVPQNSKGDAVKRMVLDWDGKSFSAVTRMPLVSVISPQFVRMRDDKDANVEDVNISQVSDLAAVADTDKPAHEPDAEPSKIIEREVYTKTMRGNQMVRKLLLWKTNKEDRPEFPSYVVYLTDFSPNRQNPLERDIRVAETLTAARRMYDDLAKKNFIGGWEKE